MNNEKIIKTGVFVNDYTIRETFENGCYRIITYYDINYTKICYTQYYNSNNEQHRENDKSSFISYYKNGNIKYKEWLQNGKCHRLTGPAMIMYDRDGKNKSKIYWINGKRYTKEEWQKENNLYKNLELFS